MSTKLSFFLCTGKSNRHPCQDSRERSLGGACAYQQATSCEDRRSIRPGGRGRASRPRLDAPHDLGSCSRIDARTLQLNVGRSASLSKESIASLPCLTKGDRLAGLARPVGVLGFATTWPFPSNLLPLEAGNAPNKVSTIRCSAWSRMSTWTRLFLCFKAQVKP
jgi:hypothetical protein